jgi:hypothetical protein
MSNAMTVKIISISEEESFGTGTFKKRELVGLEDGQYPTEFIFEFPNEKGDLLNNLSVGQTVTVDYNLRCRKVEKPFEKTRYFTSLSGWKITV